jgi:thioredoxin reductase (NADPH)
VATDQQQPQETPDVHGAFPRLSELQIDALEQQGERRRTEAGEVLFKEGDRDYDFYVVLEGKVAIVSGYPHEERPIAVHGPGRFLGELSLLTGEASFFTAVAREPGEVLVVPVERLRAAVASDSELGDLVMRAYLLRRDLLIGLGAGLKIIGSRFSPDTKRLREFAARNRVPHRWIDLEDDADAEQVLSQLGVAPDETPVVVLGEQVLRNPRNSELAAAIGLRQRARSADLADLLVVGAGPAGLAAAVYGASEGLETVVLDAVAAGGQAATSPRIENYLGFPSGISGSDLAERAIVQARKFGADLGVPSQAASLHEVDGHYVARLDDGQEVATRAVLIATGARYRRLQVANLERFEGVSVLYAATHVEAMLCSGDPIVVVGGGNSAGQASLFLAEHAAQVRLLVRNADLAQDMSRYLIDRLERSSVDVRTCTEVRELIGDGDQLQEVVVADRHTGEQQRLPARAMFVFIGAKPHTDWLGELIDLDDDGFVLTGPAVRRTSALETSHPGVFAAGDVRSGSIKRVASAVGEGSMAVRFVHAHLEGRHP